MKRMESYFPDLPRGKQRERVEEVRTRLQKAVPAPVEKLATRVDLERFLPGDLYGMSAVQAIEEAPAKVGRVSVTALSRVFRSGEREAYVRVVDAGQAPDFRTQVLGEMSGLGDEHQGYAHGRLVAGYPAVATYFPKAASSRVVAIVGNRYLIEVRVSHAKTPYDAQEIFVAMEPSRLAPPDAADAKH
jgi:hypothetical protein